VVDAKKLQTGTPGDTGGSCETLRGDEESAGAIPRCVVCETNDVQDLSQPTGLVSSQECAATLLGKSANGVVDDLLPTR